MREFVNNTLELKESLKIGPESKDLRILFAEKATEMELAFLNKDLKDEFWKILEKIKV